MSANEDNARAFANSFDPPLNAIRTERVNGMKVKDAWTCAWADSQKGIGMTAVFMGGQVRAYFEFVRKGPNAVAEAVSVMNAARAVGESDAP